MPLDMAASRGHIHVVKYLVENFSDRGWMYWESAKLEAAKNGHIDIVEYLACKQNYRKGNSRSLDHREILSVMILGGNTKAVATLLNRENYANVNTKDKDGNYPISIAVSNGDAQMVFYLLHGCLTSVTTIINSYDYVGRQPTHLAAINGYDVIMEMLVNCGAEFDNSAQNDTRNTPLHYAAGADSNTCCKILVDKGANMSSRNHEGDTPLHIAVLERALRAVIYLVQRGANVTIENNFAETPYKVAQAMFEESPSDHVLSHIINFLDGIQPPEDKEWLKFPNLLDE